MRRRKSFIFTIALIIFATFGILLAVGILYVRYTKFVHQSDSTPPRLSKFESSVLYINSYDPTYMISKPQVDGINKVFERNQIHYDILYMDTKNLNSPVGNKQFYERVKYKIQTSKKYDAILVSDDAALSFVQKYQNELFADTPIVFFGINDLENAALAGQNQWITGSVEPLFYEETLRAAIIQNPKSHNIYTIIDNTPTGQGDRKQYLEVVKKYPNLNFHEIGTEFQSAEAAAEVFKQIPEDSIIIIVSILNEFPTENQASIYDFITFLKKYTKDIPLYRTHPLGIGLGFVGGKIPDDREAARKAAETVVDILCGEDISTIPVWIEDDGFFCFDYNVIKAHNYTTDFLPLNTKMINDPNAGFRQYSSQIMPFALIIFSVLLLFAAALFSYKRAINANGVMMVMNQRMRQTNKELNDSKFRLTYVANNDKLTGLPNRSYADEEIKHIMDSGVPFSLAIMDLDDFKNYNNTYTHVCGDTLLVECGKRLSSICRNNDYFAARYGGDEFLLIHKNGHIERHGKEIEELREILNEPVFYNNVKLDVAMSVGFADYLADMDYDELVTNADLALFEAKKVGHGAIMCFTPEMKETVIKRNRIVEILKEECIRGGFEIRYQPQVNAKTGETYGFEALVRLQNYSFGPADFIPVAEDGGFIAQIGRIVTEKVISQMAQWREEGMELKKVAINYSNGQLVDDLYVPYLKSLLERYDIDSKYVDIEITESLFMGNTARATKLFKDLAAIGVGLALDDFGTGYSSLSYLTFVPAEKVKIDKSLVDNYLVEGKESFIQNIVHLVHDLGMKLTVEGVEQKWQYDKLRKMNCDFIQGYFFSKPIDPDSVPNFSAQI